MAQPCDDSLWVQIAESGTATHVETLARQQRQVCEAEQREQAVVRQERRSLTYFWDHDGCLVVEGRLPPEQGALLVKALEAADAALCEDASVEAPEVEPRSWRARQADALTLVAESALASCPTGLSAGERHTVQVHVDLPALCDGDDDSRASGRRRHVEHGPAIARDVARRLACDGGLVGVFEDGVTGTTLDVGRKTRAIPLALRRALAARDGGCRFPGCTATRYVDAHHIEHWADGGETKLDNLLTVCRFHHGLLHEGGFSLTARASAEALELRFFRPDGREIPAVPKASPPPNAGLDALEREHREAGVAIDARTCVPGWGGERADYPYMLVLLGQRAERAARG